MAPFARPGCCQEAQQATGTAGSQAGLTVLNTRRLELWGRAADTTLALALAGATASGVSSGSSSWQQRRAGAACCS